VGPTKEDQQPHDHDSPQKITFTQRGKRKIYRSVCSKPLRLCRCYFHLSQGLLSKSSCKSLCALNVRRVEWTLPYCVALSYSDHQGSTALAVMMCKIVSHSGPVNVRHTLNVEAGEPVWSSHPYELERQSELREKRNVPVYISWFNICASLDSNPRSLQMDAGPDIQLQLYPS
jgi:hypothetical protein